MQLETPRARHHDRRQLAIDMYEYPYRHHDPIAMPARTESCHVKSTAAAGTDLTVGARILRVVPVPAPGVYWHLALSRIRRDSRARGSPYNDRRRRHYHIIDEPSTHMYTAYARAYIQYIRKRYHDPSTVPCTRARVRGRHGPRACTGSARMRARTRGARVLAIDCTYIAPAVATYSWPWRAQSVHHYISYAPDDGPS